MKKSILICSAFLLLFGINNVFSGDDSSKAKPVRVWTGLTSSDWYTASNWTPGIIPNASDSVIIPGNTPNDPVLGESFNQVICKGLNLESSGIKSSRAGMTISGGEIIIDGSLTIKAGATLTIGSDGALTVNGDIKIASTGGLDVESGGSLITNGSITGYAFVKRLIPGDLDWHFLSCPVTSHAILDGTFAPTAANFPTTPVNTFDFYTFNSECAPLWWLNLRNTDGTVNTTDFGNPPAFVVQNGYLVAYGAGFPTTKVFTGTPNTGDKTYTLTVGTGSCSWNLLGNPYPSALSWNNVTGKGNLTTGYYYVWNENKDGGPGYEAYLDETYKTSGTNGNIPSMQAFFVIAKPTGGRLIGIPNTARVHDGDLWMKKSASETNKLTLTLSNGPAYDEAFVLFGSNGDLGKDWYDAEKLMSLNTSIPQIYTMVDNDQKTLLNSMPFVSNPVSVPIGFVAPAEGNYRLKVSGVENFSSLEGLTLEDLNTKTSQDMILNPVYTFNTSGIEDAGRFVLHFTSPIGVNDQKENSAIRIFASHKTIFVTSNTSLQNGQVSVYNLLGQEILTRKLSNQSMNQVTLTAPGGYYVVKVMTDGDVKTAKVNIMD